MTHLHCSTFLLVFNLCQSQVNDPLTGWNLQTPNMNYAAATLFTGYEPSDDRIWLVGGTNERVMSYKISSDSMTYHGTISSSVTIATEDANAQSSVQWGDNSIIFINSGNLRQFEFSPWGMLSTNIAMNYNRNSPCVAAIYPDWIFATGGMVVNTDIEVAGQESNLFQIVDTRATWTWSVSSQNMLYARTKHACVVHDNYLYVFGGSYYSSGQKVQPYSERIYLGNMPLLGSWSTIAYTAGSNVYFHRAVSHILYNHIYLIGGRNSIDGTPSKNIQIYDVTSNTIELINSGSSRRLDYGRSSPGTILVNNRIYVFGGFDDLSNTYSSWERSNILTFSPTKAPTSSPTPSPTPSPTLFPTPAPTKFPSKNPSISPSKSPTKFPTTTPSKLPSKYPSKSPSKLPSKTPSKSPTDSPTESPSIAPTEITSNPTETTLNPSTAPTYSPSDTPSYSPSDSPSVAPSFSPSDNPSYSPSLSPSVTPSIAPSFSPTKSPEDSLLVDPDMNTPTIVMSVKGETTGDDSFEGTDAENAENAENAGLIEILPNYSIVIVVFVVVIIMCTVVVFCATLKLKQKRKTMRELEHKESTSVNKRNIEMIHVQSATDVENVEMIGSTTNDIITPFGDLGDLLDDSNNIYDANSGLQEVISLALIDDGIEKNKNNFNETNVLTVTPNVLSDEYSSDEGNNDDSIDDDDDDCEDLYTSNLKITTAGQSNLRL